MGLIPREDKRDAASDMVFLGAVKDPTRAPAAPAGAPASATKGALQRAQALAGRKAEDVPDIPQDSLAEYDPKTGEKLPTINYKEQKELGATATWDGNINVGDIFAGLSGAGKNAVLFHEYLHDTDDLTNAGLNDNLWTKTLPEPDDTPSGKNWTETLAYRQMGDWADVLNLPWPKSLNN